MLHNDNSWRPFCGAYLLILTTPSSLPSTAMAAGESGLDDELAALTFEIEGGGYNNGGGQEGSGGLVPRDGRRGGRSMAPGSKNVVCIHYLVGMCALDKDCPYLHQYDLDRVPICPYVLGREDGGDACHTDDDGHLSDLAFLLPHFPRFGSKCVRDDDCPFKHVTEVRVAGRVYRREAGRDGGKGISS